MRYASRQPRGRTERVQLFPRLMRGRQGASEQGTARAQRGYTSGFHAAFVEMELNIFQKTYKRQKTLSLASRRESLASSEQKKTQK